MNILIDEDRDHNVNDSIERLRQEGHDVKVCRTAKEGFDILEKANWGRKHTWVPDMLLTDLELPFGGDGYRDVYPGVEPVKSEQIIPHAGLALAVGALRFTQLVAILTDTDHHHGDPIQALLDLVGYWPHEDRPHAPICRVEARVCERGWLNLKTGQRVNCRSKIPREEVGGADWVPVKDWHKLATHLMPKSE